jgi:hypothetical protein
VGHFNRTDAPWCRPAVSFERFCRNRDYIVQKYGGNAIIGYLYHLQSTAAGPELDKPGPAKWAWPTLNYFMAQVSRRRPKNKDAQELRTCDWIGNVTRPDSVNDWAGRQGR